MRVTDDRYAKDWQRLDLAVRMIQHEARTCTIRTWTGLSDDRIRKLYRTYVQLSPHRAVRRHRGKSPSQIGFFLRNRESRRQAALLAGLYTRLGLLNQAKSNPRTSGGAPSMRWGGLFCSAYETYLELGQRDRLSFEHAWYLLDALERDCEVGVAACPTCGALMLIDRLRVASRCCTFCELHPSRKGALGMARSH
jgi:hypothetical protein